MLIRPGVSHSLPGVRVVQQHEGVALLLKADFPQSHLAFTTALGVTDYPASVTSTNGTSLRRKPFHRMSLVTLSSQRVQAR